MIGSYLAAQLVIQFLISSPAEGQQKIGPARRRAGPSLWEDHSFSGPVAFGECLRDGAPQSGKETPSAPLNSNHKGYGLTTDMTAAQQWTKLRNPLETSVLLAARCQR